MSLANPEDSIAPPGFTVKWDVQSDDKQISREFSVTEYRYYDIQLFFHSVNGPLTSDGLRELFRFTGDGALEAVTKESADSDNPSVVIVTNPEESRTRDLGIASGRYVWRSAHSGVVIPLHLRVERLAADRGAEHVTEVDRDFRTWNIEGSFPGFSPSSPGGVVRHITSVKLQPGRYRLIAKTLEPISLPTGIDTYLLLTYRANTRALKPGE
jgi:Domain of unknown function (DUF5625)